MSDKKIIIAITNKVGDIVKALKRGHDVTIKVRSGSVVIEEVRCSKI